MKIREFSHGKSSRVAFLTGFIVATVSLLSLGVIGLGTVSAASDCASNNNSDDNAIIYCGFSSPSTFISKVKSNDSGNPSSQYDAHDLQDVYAHYGLEPADYDKFVSSAEQGEAYSNGDIVVDGQTVATGGKSIGRLANYQGADYFTTPINGKNYYGNTNAKAFASGVSSLPVEVLFNSQGVMQFAVFEACGNPEFGTPVTPSASCKELNMTHESGTTYQFTTNTSASDNASIDKVVYTFGDGSSVTETNPSTPVTHTYTSDGTFTAKVTVYVHLPGNQEVTVTSSTCQKTVTITLPYFQCVQLTGAILDQSKMSYSFTAEAKYGGGATLTSADFSFGDGATQDGVKPSSASATSITVDHTYAAADTYNASVVLHFTVNGQAASAPACPALVSPTAPPTPECKPGVPEGSVACSPCPSDASLPSDSPQCTTAPPAASLPNTGAGDTIAIFSGVAVAGFLVYRQLLFRKHKAAFADAQRGTSPLPLGDPLNDSNPLADTPLAPHKRSFRRKRPY